MDQERYKPIFNPSYKRMMERKEWEKQQAPMKRFKRPAYQNLKVVGGKGK